MPATAGNRRFSVLYEGDRIGAHTVSYSSASGDAQVKTDIHLQLKLGFFTSYAFRHRSEEIWRAGLLMSLRGETVEDGETLHVDGEATPYGFRVVSNGGPFIAPAATLTSNSLWTPAVLEQATVVDAQHGGVIGVSSHGLADDLILIAGRQVRATRHAFITPYIAGTIWYDGDGIWVRGEFERDGATILYQLDT